MKLHYDTSEVYEEKTYLKQYNDNYFRIIHCRSVRKKGFELPDIPHHLDKEEVERCSISRSRRNIRELAFCNPFTHFVTFTIKPDLLNRFDLDECQDKVRSLMKAYKRKNKNLIYLFITEKHLKRMIYMSISMVILLLNIGINWAGILFHLLKILMLVAIILLNILLKIASVILLVLFIFLLVD